MITNYPQPYSFAQMFIFDFCIACSRFSFNQIHLFFSLVSVLFMTYPQYAICCCYDYHCPFTRTAPESSFRIFTKKFSRGIFTRKFYKGFLQEIFTRKNPFSGIFTWKILYSGFFPNRGNIHAIFTSGFVSNLANPAPIMLGAKWSDPIACELGS